jgi:hypothetical protein
MHRGEAKTEFTGVDVHCACTALAMIASLLIRSDADAPAGNPEEWCADRSDRASYHSHGVTGMASFDPMMASVLFTTVTGPLSPTVGHASREKENCGA